MYGFTETNCGYPLEASKRGSERRMLDHQLDLLGP